MGTFLAAPDFSTDLQKDVKICFLRFCGNKSYHYFSACRIRDCTKASTVQTRKVFITSLLNNESRCKMASVLVYFANQISETTIGCLTQISEVVCSRVGITMTK